MFCLKENKFIAMLSPNSSFHCADPPSSENCWKVRLGFIGPAVIYAHAYAYMGICIFLKSISVPQYQHYISLKYLLSNKGVPRVF